MPTKHAVSNSDDVIDSRDVIARIAELESDRDDLQSTITEAEEALAKDTGNDDLVVALADAKEALELWDDQDELKALQSLADEASGSPDWTYGETLVRDSYFEAYARELAEDVGAINKDQSWPNNCIDWDEAADQLKQDYMSVDYAGVEYWIRA